MPGTTGSRDSGSRNHGYLSTRSAASPFRSTLGVKPSGLSATGWTVCDRHHRSSGAGNGVPGVRHNRASRRKACQVSGTASFRRVSWQPTTRGISPPTACSQGQDTQRSGRARVWDVAPPVTTPTTGSGTVAQVEREGSDNERAGVPHASVLAESGTTRSAGLCTARCHCPSGSPGVVTPNVLLAQVASSSTRGAGRQPMTWPDRATAFDVTTLAALSVNSASAASPSRTVPARRTGINRAVCGSTSGNVSLTRLAPPAQDGLVLGRLRGRGQAVTAADGRTARRIDGPNCEEMRARAWILSVRRDDTIGASTRAQHPAWHRSVWSGVATRGVFANPRTTPGSDRGRRRFAGLVNHPAGQEPARADCGKHLGCVTGPALTAPGPLPRGMRCTVRSDTGPWG
jgi:hypothetical protein